MATGSSSSNSSKSGDDSPPEKRILVGEEVSETDSGGSTQRLPSEWKEDLVRHLMNNPFYRSPGTYVVNNPELMVKCPQCKFTATG